MFPISFTSKADKERQYRLYQQKITKDAALDQVKQEAYGQASWASDLESTVDVDKMLKRRTDNINEKLDQLITLAKDKEIKSEVKGALDGIIDTIEFNDAKSKPSETDKVIDALNKLIETNQVSKNELKEVIKELAANLKPIKEEKRSSLEQIRELYKRNTLLAKSRIRPIKKETSNFDDTVYLGANAELLTNKGYKSTKKTEYDWDATLDKINYQLDQMIISGDSTPTPMTDSEIKRARVQSKGAMSESELLGDENEEKAPVPIIGRGFNKIANRKGMLKHEMFKLQGQVELGNNNKRNRRELDLLKRYLS